MSDEKISADKLSFPLQLGITIVTTIVTIVISVMSTTSGIRTDLALMKQLAEIREQQKTEQVTRLEKNLAMLQERVLEIQEDMARKEGEENPKIQLTRRK